MDDRRFDELTKTVAGGASRRVLLKGLLGGGLAAALAAIGLGEADAQEVEAAATCRSRCRRIKSRTRRRRCLRRCRGGGGTINPQPVSTNPKGSRLGSTCTTATTCTAGTICFNGKCTLCVGQCPTGPTTTCCAAGVCQAING